MKKKTLSALLVAALLAIPVVSGCSSGSETNASGNTPAANSSAEGATNPQPESLDYPTKPIDFVVPFAAGGSNDLVARTIAGYLSEEWGQTINVVNKPGGGGAVGLQEVLKNSKPDGYTVVAVSTSSTSALLAGNTSLPFGLEDFKFISKVVEDPITFVVKADAPWKDLKEFSEWAKNNTDQLSYATPGPSGTSTYATAEWLDAIGADFSKARLITSTGSADSLPKVAGGHITVAALGVNDVSSMVNAGKIKILGVSSKERSKYFPDVPTAEEQGIQNLTVSFWNGVAAPAGTPDEIVKKWDDAIAKMTKDPKFEEMLKKINSESAYLNSADLKKQVEEELEKVTKIAIEKGLRKQ